MSSNPQPRVWTHDDLEPTVNPDFNFPKVVDKYGVYWCADEREDGFEGWRSDSHGFRVWRTWFNLTFERGPLNEYQDTSQASCVGRSEAEVCRYAPTPSAALAQISEAVFLGVVRASGDWENWDGNQIAAAVDRARRVLNSEGIEVVS